MRFIRLTVSLCAFVVMGMLALDTVVPWTAKTVRAQSANTAASTTGASATSAATPSSTSDEFLVDMLRRRPKVMWGGGIVIALMVVAGGSLLYRTTLSSPAGSEPLIFRLTPSFFFWLGMTYTGVLLALGAIYDQTIPASSKPILIGSILPIAVPWFGALGAVTISLEGVFLWNHQWDSKFNHWHIGRPLFGATLGIVAFFLFVVIVSASGSTPKFLEGTRGQAKDYIIFYVVAFLVGYREETFRELIKRATDLILKPAPAPASAPAITFKVGGAAASQIQFPTTAVGTPATLVVEVQNSGGATMTDPRVAIAPVAPTPANVFALANDHVTGGGDLAASQSRTVDITFTPAAAGAFEATVTVTGKNLGAPKTIKVTGTA